MRRKTLPYKRGSGSVEVELANLQSAVERIDPDMEVIAGKVDSLEATRDNIRGMLWLILAGQGLVVGLILWGLNHIQVVQISTK